MTLIYDCFTYSGESDLFAARVNLLDSIVDFFVVVQGTHSHAGAPRRVATQEDLRQMLPNPGKLRYVLDAEVPDQDAWVNERRQRNKIALGLFDAAADDLILVSDVDEIPNPNAVRRIAGQYAGPAAFEMVWHSWAVNLAYTKLWDHARIVRFADLTTPQELREKSANIRVRHGGWHLSWLMSAEEAELKMQAFAHTEIARSAAVCRGFLQRCALLGVDVLGRDILRHMPRHDCIPIDEFYGRYERQMASLRWVRALTLAFEGSGRSVSSRAIAGYPRTYFVLIGFVVFGYRRTRRLARRLKITRNAFVDAKTSV